jgi:hypothetical protein
VAGFSAGVFCAGFFATAGRFDGAGTAFFGLRAIVLEATGFFAAGFFFPTPVPAPAFRDAVDAAFAGEGFFFAVGF